MYQIVSFKPVPNEFGGYEYGGHVMSTVPAEAIRDDLDTETLARNGVHRVNDDTYAVSQFNIIEYIGIMGRLPRNGEQIYATISLN